MASAFSKKLENSSAITDVLRESLRSSSTSALIKQGYTYLQISNLLSAAIAAGLILEKDGKLTLTKNGKENLTKSNSNQKFIWVKPLNELRVAKIKKDDLYIVGRHSLRKLNKQLSRTSN